MAELLGLCVAKRVYIFNCILEQHLLAHPSDKLRLTRLLSNLFKGDSKPLEEELQFANNTLLRTLYWRTQASPQGHLVQGVGNT